MSDPAPLPVGLLGRPTEGQLRLLRHLARTPPGWQSTFALLLAAERENQIEQRAVLVLLRLKLRRSVLSPERPVRPQRQKRRKIRG